MTGLVCTTVLIFSMLASCYCSSSIIGAMRNRLRTFNKKLNSFQIELAERDIIFHESINIATESLRQELTHHFQQQIQEAMVEFSGDESVSSVRSAHDEIRRLKQGQQTMKRQLHNVMKTLRQVQQEKDLYREAFLKAIAESCLKCSSYTKLLSYGQPSQTQASSTIAMTIDPLTSTPVQKTRIMTALMIASWDKSDLSQLNLQSNSLRKYHLHISDGVTALCFVQRLRRLLVAMYKSEKITSTTLDGDDKQTLRLGVRVRGMAVDEGRELVFMTTWKPGDTICRMSTRGENFTVIRALTREYRTPFNIAVNTREKEVFASGKFIGLFRLNYDGKGLRKLASGAIYGVTFDSVGNTLYFNDGTKLKKMSDETVLDVTILSVEPRSLAYYNNTVYFGGVRRTRYVGAVRLGKNIVETRLKTMNSNYSASLFICLVP